MSSNVTRLLTDLHNGRSMAAEELFPLVMDELHRQAAKLLRGEKPGHTLQPTALVNEAFLALIKHEGLSPADVTWQDRSHFLAVAAQVMRHILVDHARRRNRIKRGGGRSGAAGDRVPLDSALLVLYETSAGVDVELLNRALEELAGIRPRAAQIVDMRFFADMTATEIACALDVSVSTVEREWRYARAWLKDALGESPHALAESSGNDEDNGAKGG